MVIGPGKGNVIAHVILGDGEFIPEKFNDKRVVVYRKGWLTFGELKEIKAYGELAKPEDLAPPVKEACNYSGDGVPLHQHEDGAWWYFDAAWSLENGPFKTYDAGFESLLNYCNEFQEQQNAGLGINVAGDLVLFEKFGLTRKTEESKVGLDETPHETNDEICDSDGTGNLD